MGHQGLSPRGRGKPVPLGEGNQSNRSIPAWAGQTEKTVSGENKKRVYPRVGGANGAFIFVSFWRWGLSPRGRGKLCQSTRGFASLRSIPAWAGQT